MESIRQIIKAKTARPLAKSIEAAIVLAKATECGQGRWQAVRFRLGRLTLLAPAAIEAQELKLKRESIRAEINQVLGEEVVKQLVVRTE